MKLKVQIDAQTYEVEIGDLVARPIHTVVDGEAFDVWPEEAASQAERSVPTDATPVLESKPPAASVTPKPAAAPAPKASADGVRAPIPGVIISIAVQPGASVKRGQELCMLEAMKMNNAIRSPREGIVATVPVSVGQAVKHGDVLITFEP
jgi:biotin carboxyl carrier protein